MAKKTPLQKRRFAERLNAYRAAGELSRKVGALTPPERRKMIAAGKIMQKELDRMHARDAPSMESATSDLLKILNAVVMEFVKEYYPTARHASVHISLPDPPGVIRQHVNLPIELPRLDPDKAA